jgi:methanethiol S-methyltransferase
MLPNERTTNRSSANDDSVSTVSTRFTRGNVRAIGLGLGIVSLLLFTASASVLFWFLISLVNATGTTDQIQQGVAGVLGAGDARATWNTILVISWAILFQVLGRPGIRARLQRFVESNYLSSIVCMTNSLALIALCLLYQPIPTEIYSLEGGPALLVRLTFFGAWALFIACWFHQDLLEVVGLRPFLRRRVREARSGESAFPSGPFVWVRYPMELALLTAVWATPRMTIGHLLFASLASLLLFARVDAEDRRRFQNWGTAYQEYVQRVPQIIPWPR